MNRCAWLGLWLVLGGCGLPTSGYRCASSEACVDVAGVAGVCELSGFCAYPAADCPWGRRYSAHAAPELGGQCVTPDAPMPQGLWVLDSGALETPELRKGIIDFAAAHFIPSVSVRSNDLLGSDRPLLVALISEARARNIAVELLFDGSSLAYSENHPTALAYAAGAAALPAESRPAGVLFNVKPFVLPEWKTDMSGITNQYLDLLEKLRAQLEGTGVSLAATTPHWFDATTAVSRAGQTRPPGDWVLDFVDRIAIGSYRNDPDEMIEVVANEVARASALGKSVTVGVTTSCATDLLQDSYCGKGQAQLTGDVRELSEAFSTAAGFAGVFVDAYDSYAALGP